MSDLTVTLTERELTALEGAVLSKHISVQQAVEAILDQRREDDRIYRLKIERLVAGLRKQLAEAEQKHLQAQSDCDAEALRRNALHQRLIAEAEKKGAREALADLAREFDRCAKSVLDNTGDFADSMPYDHAASLCRDRAAQIGGES